MIDKPSKRPWPLWLKWVVGYIALCGFLALLSTALPRSPLQSRLGPAAQCANGGYSYSEGSGTCSHHGGVARWLR